MDKKTVLNETHREMGARMVPFGGWDMPVHYGSQLEEHHAVRRDAGMFDVCHMTVVDLRGPQVRALLRYLLANDVGKLKIAGKALYTCMLNHEGGVIDDLIVYFLTEDWFRLVVNAATTETDLAWISQQAEAFGVSVEARRDLGMIAIQGPQARTKAEALLPADLAAAAMALKPFSAAYAGEWFVARTGYTGEDGFEVMLPEAETPALWRALAAAGVRPCGLGARDTLRLEAGMNLCGADMDEAVSPLASGLTWTVALEPVERDFIGRSALEKQRAAGSLPQFIGLVLEGKGVLRGHQRVYDGDRAVGEITSGGFSPTLERSVAMARVAAAGAAGQDALRTPRSGPYRTVIGRPAARSRQMPSLAQSADPKKPRGVSMSNDVPNDLKYSKSHEWVRVDDAGIATVGITDHAQELLGDLVFVELPEVGAEISAGSECAVVESVKAASDVYSPLSGEVVEVNEALADAPETINQDAYEEGWIFRLRMADPDELDALMDADGYAEHAESEEH